MTIGPKGRNVVLERSFGVPEVVNDGVTIARDIELENVKHNVGAKLIVEVASKSDQKAGDGTTTSCVLTQALVGEGLKLVASGANPIALQRGLQKVRRLSRESALTRTRTPRATRCSLTLRLPLAPPIAQASKLLAAEIKALAKPVDSDDDIRNIACIVSSTSRASPRGSPAGVQTWSGRVRCLFWLSWLARQKARMLETLLWQCTLWRNASGSASTLGQCPQATNSDQMGRTIATCFQRVGANGATMVEDGQVRLLGAHA